MVKKDQWQKKMQTAKAGEIWEKIEQHVFEIPPLLPQVITGLHCHMAAKTDASANAAQHLFSSV